MPGSQCLCKSEIAYCMLELLHVSFSGLDTTTRCVTMVDMHTMCAGLHAIAVRQQQTVMDQNADIRSLQNDNQSLVDTTADMTVQLVLFKCYLDAADKHERSLKVSCFFAVCCMLPSVAVVLCMLC